RHFTEAAKTWKELVSTSSDADSLTAAARFFTSCTLPDFRDLKIARQAVEKSRSLSPKIPVWALLEARIQLLEGEPAKSIETLKQVALDPDCAFLNAERNLLLVAGYHRLKDQKNYSLHRERAEAQLKQCGPGDWYLRELMKFVVGLDHVTKAVH